MSSGLLVVILVLLGAQPAAAWTVTLSSDVTAGATNYKVEKSTNLTAWTEITNPLARPTTPVVTYTGIETGVVYFRFSTCNAVGCTTRPQDGVWHNESLAPPPGPASIMTQ
jgi:hypothetical protein